MDRWERSIRQQAEREGWTVDGVESTRGGHLRLAVSYRGHKARLTMAATPSDRRAAANNRSLLRRLIRPLQELHGEIISGGLDHA